MKPEKMEKLHHMTYAERVEYLVASFKVEQDEIIRYWSEEVIGLGQLGEMVGYCCLLYHYLLDNPPKISKGVYETLALQIKRDGNMDVIPQVLEFQRTDPLLFSYFEIILEDSGHVDLCWHFLMAYRRLLKVQQEVNEMENHETNC